VKYKQRYIVFRPELSCDARVVEPLTTRPPWYRAALLTSGEVVEGW